MGWAMKKQKMETRAMETLQLLHLHLDDSLLSLFRFRWVYPRWQVNHNHPPQPQVGSVHLSSDMANTLHSCSTSCAISDRYPRLSCAGSSGRDSVSRWRR